MSFGGLTGGGATGGDKSLSLPLTQIFKLAWADEDLRARLMFVLKMFAVFAIGIHIPVPIPGVDTDTVMRKLTGLQIFQLLDSFGGGAMSRLSVFALGLGPYITASIIIQVVTATTPSLKKELEEGGEYARKKQNKRTRTLTLLMCALQGWGYLSMISSGDGVAMNLASKFMVLAFWTAGAMFTLWIGEQISERGIGNGVSLMIFAGILVGIPYQGQKLFAALREGAVQWYQVAMLLAIFLIVTWLVVHFTSAQRRIPIQNMRRVVGTKAIGGKTSYLPFALLMSGVMPIIFASSLIYMPQQIAAMLGTQNSETGPGFGRLLFNLNNYINPTPNGLIFGMNLPINPIGVLVYVGMILFFSYFWSAIQYNVEDISDNLKRRNSVIPGVRPGKQTKDFLDQIISKVTVIGALFISIVALLQYVIPTLTRLSYAYGVGVVGGTTLLIMVSVALETMRQIEANLLMKQYD